MNHGREFPVAKENRGVIRYRFCPCCGASLKKKRIQEMERLVCSSCEFIFFRNSKPCVAGLILKEGSILLTKRAFEPFAGYWDIPGGFLEEGEDPRLGLKRELHEELGLRCKISDCCEIFVDQYGDTGYATLTIFYFVEPFGTIKKVSDDVIDCSYFPLDKLPRHIAFASSRRILKLLRKNGK